MGIRYTYAESESFRTEPVLVEKTITTNGSYDAASDNADGYSVVTVNVEGGGGGSWQTVFEGSVETVDDDGDIFGIIENLTLTGDSIKATLNGTEYILPKTEHGYGAENESGIDFSTYPLFIATSEEGFCNLWTPTAGTYTLKIEEPQSGGSSDFSTAEVTFNKGELGAEVTCIIPWFSEEDNETNAFLTLDGLTESWTVKVPVGGNFITVYFSRTPQSISGDIEAVSDMDIMSQTLKAYVITGDCTVNFS